MTPHAMALTTFATTGSRPGVPLRARFQQAPTAARTVRTWNGIVLYDEAGRQIGVVAAPTARRPSFGPGAETVLLRR